MPALYVAHIVVCLFVGLVTQSGKELSSKEAKNEKMERMERMEPNGRKKDFEFYN